MTPRYEQRQHLCNVTPSERHRLAAWQDRAQQALYDMIDAFCDMEHGGPVDVLGIMRCCGTLTTEAASLHALACTIKRQAPQKGKRFHDTPLPDAYDDPPWDVEA